MRQSFFSSNEVFDAQVFIDIFRASTSLTYLMTKKPAEVLGVVDRDRILALKHRGYILFSEVFEGGLDNSPSQILSTDIEGKGVVHSTTNFTFAVLKNLRSVPAFVASFCNLASVVKALKISGAQKIEIVTAGHFDKRTSAIEDDECARILKQRLLGDLGSAKFSNEFLESLERRRLDSSFPNHYFKDIDLALRIDSLEVVPMLERIDSHTFCVR